MKTERITAKTISLSILSALIIAAAFVGVSCTKAGPQVPVSSEISSTEENSAPSSSAPANQDMMTEENKQYYIDNYVYPYYAHLRLDFDGEITSEEMGNGMFRLCMNNGGASNEYLVDDSFIVPEDTGDRMINDSFKMKVIDRSKIPFYIPEKKAYVINMNDMGYGTYVCVEADSITQDGDRVVVTASFYNPDEGNVDENGKEKPNYNEKLATYVFTLKSYNDKYLYEKVSTNWFIEH